MPQRPSKGRFPISLRDYRVADPAIHELLMNYDNGELYVVQGDGTLISISEDIFWYIVASKIQNADIIIVDAPDKDVVTPPVEERKYNGWYFCVTKRRDK